MYVQNWPENNSFSCFPVSVIDTTNSRFLEFPLWNYVWLLLLHPDSVLEVLPEPYLINFSSSPFFSDSYDIFIQLF